MQNSHRRIAIVVSLALGLLSVPYLALSFSPSQSLQVLAINAGLYYGQTPTPVTPSPTPVTPSPTPVTPTPVTTRVADLGFQPTGRYQFPNWGSDGQNSNDFTVADLRAMFGDSNVCRTGSTATVCRVNRLARRWLNNVTNLTQIGHSDGFTTTALRFFKGLDTLGTFQTGTVTTTNDLRFTTARVRSNITKYWVLQLPFEVASARATALKNTPSVVVDQVIAAANSTTISPTTLLVYNADRTSGHSLLPYAVDKTGDLFKIFVYDSNWPTDSTRFVEVNKALNTWSYDLGNGRLWTGTATSQSLGAVSISAYALPPTAPWNTTATHFLVHHEGRGHVLVTKFGTTERIGYDTKVFTNTLANAFAAPIAGGIDAYQEPEYYVPTGNKYTYHLTGDAQSQGLAQTSGAGLSQIGPNFAVGVSNFSLNATSDDTLDVSPDGTQVAYTANQTRSVDLSLSYNGTSTSSEIQVNGFDVGTGKLFTATAQTVSNTVKLTSTSTITGSYNLVVTVVTATGEVTFQNNNISFTPGSIQTLDFTGLANGGLTVTLGIDTNGDGIIDSTVNLPNQAPGTHTYFPLVRR